MAAFRKLDKEHTLDKGCYLVQVREPGKDIVREAAAQSFLAAAPGLSLIHI